MNIIDRGFDVATATASLSNAPRTGLKMGACLMSGPRLLSVGANLYGKSHPDSHNGKFIESIHAEHACLLRRRHYDLNPSLTLYVARVRADGSVGCSKPCANCLELCRVAGVQRIRYVDQHGQRKGITL